MEVRAIQSLYKILGQLIVGKITLLEWIFDDSSQEAREWLQPLCQSMPELESFLNRNSDYFMVENDMVCIPSPNLVRGREGAVSYYSDILSTYREPCLYSNFRGHIGQANRDIQSFIENFYPEEDFMDFLLAHPDDFVVFDDDTVHQVQAMEEKSIGFFKNCLKKYGGGYYFTNFQGHYTHSKYIRQYIQQYYPEEEFLIFLQNNDDVFDLEDGYVYLRKSHN